MRFLITNDDGIDALGIKMLRTILEEYGEVVTYSPNIERSGAGSCATFFSEIKASKINELEYKVYGTPVDCVALGLSRENIDLVVSGINQGFNQSNDTFYSGTFNAAVHAAMMGVPSVAISAQWPNIMDSFDMAKESLKFIIDNKLYSNEYVLNVNLPLSSYKKALGIKITTLFKEDIKLVSKNENDTYLMHRYSDRYDAPVGTDSWAIKHGYISITPLQINYSSDVLIDRLNKLLK